MGAMIRADPPAAWVMGAATRCTAPSIQFSFREPPIIAAHARLGIITPLGAPVVPPEELSTTTVSGVCGMSGATSPTPAMKSSRDGERSSASSTQTVRAMRGQPFISSRTSSP